MKHEPRIISSLHEEFVLIGPVGDRDRIIAKSQSAGLDLVGLAMDKTEHPNTGGVLILPMSSHF